MVNYNFWDANKIYRIKTDIIENIKDILSAVINEGEFYTLKNDIDMAHVDGGIIVDNVREVGLIDDNYGISVRIDKPLTGNLIEETIDGYCVDSLLALRNLLFKEIVSPIYEKIEDIAGSIGIKSLPEDFIVTIDDINYGDSFKAVVKHIANNVCKDGGVEIYVVPVDESISKEELKFPDTAIATIKEFKELVDFAAKSKDKNIKYKWFAESNDGAFEDESRKSFATKKECYNDMRNAALEKMKWNTEFDEDFDDMEDGNYIGYNVRFSKDKIIHESYSGIYTYEIGRVYEE